MLYSNQVRGFIRICPGAYNKKCPYCAEMIKKDAIVCHYCGRELSSSASSDDILDHMIEKYDQRENDPPPWS